MSRVIKGEDSLNASSADNEGLLNKIEKLEEENKKLKNSNCELSEEIVKKQDMLCKLREKVSKKTRFISDSSHEFRTPLTSILTSVEILEMVGRSCDEKKFFDNICRIKESVMNMTNLMDDVISINRMEKGEWGFKPEKTNLYNFCIKIIEEINNADFNRHCINFNYKVKRKIYFDLDQKLLRHIFSNLLSNASKYSNKGETINFDVEGKNDLLYFCVEDHGIGIKAEDQKLLYSPFFRGKNVKDIRGTGLGLAIAKKATEKHGGVISFESREGLGAKFNVIIPVSAKSAPICREWKNK
jgi:signal transduction histidine kinase